MHWVQSAEYKEGYKIVVEFEDGSRKEVDLEHHLDQGVFQALKQIDKFKGFRVNHDTDTIEWENGADLSPDFLYAIGGSVDQYRKKAA